VSRRLDFVALRGVSELAVIGRASVLVPFPHAPDRDQAANAAPLAKSGGAIVAPQAEFTPARLAAILRDAILRDALAAPAKLETAAAAAKASGGAARGRSSVPDRPRAARV
jgi:UDP-N-acetylglucosamine--N-acetylmuramyl-(pentapeptide) pyrophosphoryl-undecaprenol N-acetylglucosamine transferase